MEAVALDRGPIAAWLAEEAPGPDAILGHAVATGHGRAWADRWPHPSTLLVEVGENYLLAGEVRALVAADTDAVARLSPEVEWITKTWGGPAGLASHGHAYGAFVGGQLVAVGCTFFMGARH